MAIKKAIILTIFEVSRFMTFETIFSIFLSAMHQIVSKPLSVVDISNTLGFTWNGFRDVEFPQSPKEFMMDPTHTQLLVLFSKPSYQLCSMQLECTIHCRQPAHYNMMTAQANYVSQQARTSHISIVQKGILFSSKWLNCAGF